MIASSLLVERHGHAMCFLPTPGPAAAAAPAASDVRRGAAAYGDATQCLAEARIKETAWLVTPTLV